MEGAWRGWGCGFVFSSWKPCTAVVTMAVETSHACCRCPSSACPPLPLPHATHPDPMQVSQHGRCRVRITVQEEAGEVPQQGHKVSLSGLLVTHFPVRLQSKRMAAAEELLG